MTKDSENQSDTNFARAPGSEVCTVDACGLDESHGGQGLRLPEAEGLPSESGFHDPEAFDSDALLHLGEVASAGALSRYPQGFRRLGWCLRCFTRSLT